MTLGFGALIGWLLARVSTLKDRRLAHQRHLRLVRAELNRLATYRGRFPTVHPLLLLPTRPPPPPTPVTFWDSLIADLDFRLTDAYYDDPTPEVLIQILRGCEDVEDACARVVDCIAEARAIPSELHPMPPGTRAFAYLDFAVEEHHARLQAVLNTIAKATVEIARRLDEVGPWRQMTRRVRLFFRPLKAAPPLEVLSAQHPGELDLTIDALTDQIAAIDSVPGPPA